MVTKNSEQRFNDEDLSALVSLFNVLGNKERLSIIKSLENRAKRFSSFSKKRDVNLNAVNENLRALLSHGIIFKTHGRENYDLTPKGHAILRVLIDGGLNLLKHLSPTDSKITCLSDQQMEARYVYDSAKSIPGLNH